MNMPDDLAVNVRRIAAATTVVSWFSDGSDLEPEWAERNPERAMAWFFVTPRSCEARDRLSGL